MNLLKRQHGNNTIFVVCSNNIVWCRDKLADDNVYFSDSNDVYTDLAILASCNHTIVSSGSFSWWAGYLNTGTVVYYKSYPRPNSLVAKDFSRGDYYPSSWIPL
ncbi:galactoside 2-alpha-L-fucosyltransferase 3-like [Argonauta hians]